MNASLTRTRPCGTSVTLLEANVPTQRNVIELHILRDVQLQQKRETLVALIVEVPFFLFQKCDEVV